MPEKYTFSFELLVAQNLLFRQQISHLRSNTPEQPFEAVMELLANDRNVEIG
jgi:hypothetical protein